MVDELGDVEEKAKWGGKTGSRGQIGSLESDLRISRIEKFVHLIISLAVFPLFFSPLPNLPNEKSDGWKKEETYIQKAGDAGDISPPIFGIFRQILGGSRGIF